MSETGAAQVSVPDGCDRDIIGYPTPKENFRIQDDQKFYEVDDGVRTGIMYVASDSLCENELDGEVLFEYTKIDGKDFICTNDLIRVNEDGSFSYAGRADRYFVNNEGMRFEQGVVEVRVSAHPNIDKSAVVPVLEKLQKFLDAIFDAYTAERETEKTEAAAEEVVEAETVEEAEAEEAEVEEAEAEEAAEE